MAKKRGNPGLSGHLLDKSVDAYVLALETINRLSIKYRVESFCFLICNAWELLLKAKLTADAHSKKAIFQKKEHKGERKSISLRDCLGKLFPDQSNSIRVNVELIADLRDSSMHLVLSQVPKDVLGLFQSSVLNYHRCLNEWFEISLSDKVSVGMMAIVYDFKPESFDVQSSKLKKQMGKDTVEYLVGFSKSLESARLEASSPDELAIAIDYKIVLSKNPSESDIAVSLGDDGTAIGVVTVAKDPSKTHPYRQIDVVAALKAKFPDVKITSYSIQTINASNNIKKQAKYFYQGTVKSSPCQYSQAFVDWMAVELEKDKDFFNKAKLKAKAKVKPKSKG